MTVTNSAGLWPTMRARCASMLASTVFCVSVADAAAQTTSSPQIIRDVEKALEGHCVEAENQSSAQKLGIPGGDVTAANLVIARLKSQHSIEAKGNVTTVVTQQPTHGKVVAGNWSGPTRRAPLANFQYFTYVPNSEFTGKDRFTVTVTVNGMTFRVPVVVNVVGTWNNGDSCRAPGDDRG